MIMSAEARITASRSESSSYGSSVNMVMISAGLSGVEGIGLTSDLIFPEDSTVTVIAF